MNYNNLIIAPPKTFDPEMSDDDFLLFLNMYGIPYEVGCILLGKRYIGRNILLYHN